LLARHWTCVAWNIASRTSSLLPTITEPVGANSSRRGQYIRSIFMGLDIAFANEFAPTGTMVCQSHRVIVHRPDVAQNKQMSTGDHRTRGSEFIREGNGANDEDSAVCTNEIRSAFRPPRVLLILGAPSNHAGRKPILIRRASRQGCRFSRAGPGMALRGGPPNQCRITGMPSLGEGPSGGARAFCLLLRSIKSEAP